MTKETLNKAAYWLLAGLILVPFVISFGGLSDLAESNGMSYPFLYPIMIDGGLLIFKSLIMIGSLNGRRDNFAIIMAIILTLISVALNVAHAQPNLMSRFMSGLPPLAMFVSFFAVSHKVEEDTERAGIEDSLSEMKAATKRLADEKATIVAALATSSSKLADTETALSQKLARISEIDARIEEMSARLKETTSKLASMNSRAKNKSSNDRTKATERGEIVLRMLQENPGLRPEDIATELKVTTRTIQRDIASLNGRVKELA